MDAIVHAPFAEIAALLVMAAAIGLFGILLRQPLIQLTWTSGFRGRLAVSSHHPKDTEEPIASGADMVLKPFQDAADRAVDLLCGAPEDERTEIPPIETEDKQTI